MENNTKKDGLKKFLEAVGKNIVLADAAFKGQARAEKIRHGAAAAVSADPELHSAEVKSAA